MTVTLLFEVSVRATRKFRNSGHTVSLTDSLEITCIVTGCSHKSCFRPHGIGVFISSWFVYRFIKRWALHVRGRQVLTLGLHWSHFSLFYLGAALSLELLTLWTSQHYWILVIKITSHLFMFFQVPVDFNISSAHSQLSRLRRRSNFQSWWWNRFLRIP